MSIKRLPPEAIETFSVVLHPKRRYSARKPPVTQFAVPLILSIDPEAGIYTGGDEIAILGVNFELGGEVETIAEYDFANTTWQRPLGAAHPWLQTAASFVGNDQYATALTFRMWKVGSPTGNVVVALNASNLPQTDTSAVPSPSEGLDFGGTEARVTFDASTLPTSAANITIDLPEPVKLDSGVTYWAEVGYGGGDVSNYINVATDEGPDTVEEVDVGLVDSQEFMHSAHITKHAASFLGDGSTLRATRFFLNKVQGSPTGACVAKLYTSTGAWDDDASEPDTLVATSETIDAANLPAIGAPELIPFSFASLPTLAAGTSYWMSFEYSGGDATNRIGIGTNFAPGSSTSDVRTKWWIGGPWTLSVREAVFYIDRDEYPGLHKFVDNPATAWWPAPGPGNHMIELPFKVEGRDGPTVTLDGVPAEHVTFISSTEIRCRTPGGSVGPVDVMVQNPNGFSHTYNGFEYIDTGLLTEDEDFLVTEGGDILEMES